MLEVQTSYAFQLQELRTEFERKQSCLEVSPALPIDEPNSTVVYTSDAQHCYYCTSDYCDSSVFEEHQYF
ncbi:hypothetical protein GJ496_009233 [Pomphorhynchus laevis]|nr:hypothetical protein GJ496_009233 [Pomphorhynchus laevis]